MFKPPKEIVSKYKFIILSAQRTKQLMEGAEPRVKVECRNMAYTAMREVLTNKVKWLDKADVKEKSQSDEVEVEG